MTTKELSHWIDHIHSIRPPPWVTASWDEALSVFVKVLHTHLLKEDACDNSNEEKIVVTLEKVFKTSQEHLGLPQFVVDCDLKRSDSENKLAILLVLYTLRFSLLGQDICYTDPTPNFSFDKQEKYSSTSKCTICHQEAAFIERLVINKNVYHRNCLRCSVSNCSRQLSRGIYLRNLNTNGLECIDHYVNSVLRWDPIMTKSLSSTLSQAESSVPPPRPPPPNLKKRPSNSSEKKINSEDGKPDHDDYIAQQIATAMMRNHSPTLFSDENMKANKGDTGERSWEVLEYPDNLNPFSESDSEEEQRDGSIDEAENTNPFTNEDDEDNKSKAKPIKTEKCDLITSHIMKKDTKPLCPTETSSPPNLLEKKANIIDRNEETNEQIHEPPIHSVPKFKKCDDEATMKPEKEILEFTSSQNASNNKNLTVEETDHKFEYISPLSSMKFRKTKQIPSISKLPSEYSFDSVDSTQVQNVLKDLEIHLRKLCGQLEQCEITGRRLEKNALRLISAPNDKNRWKNKVIDDYLQVVDRRCEILKLEAIFVRRYMNIFLAQAHTELEKQLKQMSNTANPGSQKNSHSEHLELLVLLMEVKNELTALENLSSAAAELSPIHSSGAASRVDKSLKKEVKNKLKTFTKKFN